MIKQKSIFIITAWFLCFTISSTNQQSLLSLLKLQNSLQNSQIPLKKILAPKNSIKFSNCENYQNTNLKLNSITFDSQPTEGQTLKILMSGIGLKNVNLTSLKMTILQGGSQLNEDNSDYENSLKKNEQFKAEFDYQSPFTVPPGTYQVEMKFEDGDDEQGCFAFDMEYKSE